MKLHSYRRHLQPLLLLVLLLNLFSCKTKKDVSEYGGNYIFKNINDDISYFIKIDSAYGSYAEGRMYFMHDNLTMYPESFILNIRKNKCVVKYSDSKVLTLKLKRINEGILEGSYTSKRFSGKKDFVIYPYVAEDIQTFDLDRYKDKLFDVERIPNVSYGTAKGFWTSIPDDTIDVSEVVKTTLFNTLKRSDLDLDMDIYIPKNDTLSKRPLMMFIHGGAFFIGDKATVPYQKWCSHFASLGYVCVSINYRMGFRVNSKAIERAGYQATQDAHAAMRFLMSKKDVYRIDPDYIFVGGASAGSITAMNLAYMRNENRPKSSYSSFLQEDLGNLESSGNKIYNKFRVRAVANMWGTMYDLEMMNNSKAPIISFHGDQDVILPYRFGYPFRAIGEFQKVFFDEMYGSYLINEKAQELGIRSELHTFHGQGHALHLDQNRNLNENFYTIQDETVSFFYDELIPYQIEIMQNKDDVQMFLIDTSAVALVDWDVVGGVSIEESKGTIRASWFDDEDIHELRVSGCFKNGSGFEDVLVIKNVKDDEDNSHE